MSNETTPTEKAFEILKKNADKKFTITEIVKKLVDKHPKYYKRKLKQNKNKKATLAQIGGEIRQPKFKKMENIKFSTVTKATVFWYEKHLPAEEKYSDNLKDKAKYSENELYPKLIEYLNQVHNLNCLRIDEKTSSNTQAKGANYWLHPDIVALEAINKDWDNDVKTCASFANQHIQLWSFEVKRKLTISNVRESFFQTVSNSLWANAAYLVTSSIYDSEVENELLLLSQLHGVGVILLNYDNPLDSYIYITAKTRNKINWASVNRITKENKNFKDFISSVVVYYKTGKIADNIKINK